MIPSPASLSEALVWSCEQLAQIEQPAQESRRLLAHVLRISQATLLSRDEQVLDESAKVRFANVVLRRAAGEPYAYIVGERDFWTLTLRVTPDVLVPRPETELLVERALSQADSSVTLDCADLGTGSGCIALAIASERPGWHITATDRSSAALAIAAANAKRLGFDNVVFKLGEWFAAVGTQRFDQIVSNPPYIGADEPALANISLRHEPREALTPGADALAAFSILCKQAPHHLRDGGQLLLEHGAEQAASVRALLVAQGFAHVTSWRDLAGIERVTAGRWRSP